ncbi:MAG: hypothetical protein EXQ74_03295 [Thermoleophilia bacterium]|nr:hypothetical protein [Thermoleophilia bacterium]
MPNIGSLARRVTGRARDGLELPRHLVHYDRASLRLVLERSGLRVRSMRTIPLLGVLPRSIDATTAGGGRWRGWGDAVLVRGLLYPMEWNPGVVGQGDGILAVAELARG